MFRLPKDTEITGEIIMEFINKQKKQVKERYDKLNNAYKSAHEILELAPKAAHKPDNRIVVNFAKYIVDTMNGFFIGNPVKIVTEDEAVSEYVEYLGKYNNLEDINAELSKTCSIYGRGYEIYYTDEESQLCVAYLSPLEAFMIYDESIIERPLFFVRTYVDRYNNERGSISDGTNIRDFKITGGFTWESEWTPHNFSGVPATEYVENEERQGLFEPVLSMINAFNKAISEKANDVDYFADAYLKVLGALLENEDIAFIRDSRVLNLVGDDAEKLVAEFMDKPSNDESQENLLNRLERLIFQISMVANISDQNFGTSSGIALKYKLQPMSNLEKTKERKFSSGLDRRYKMLFGHPASKVSKDAWIKLKYHYTPNIPANLLEEAQIANQMEGVTSHETQLKVLSIVENVKEELDKIEEENNVPAEKIVNNMMFSNVDDSTKDNGDE